ncbi:MAG: hypothetical protein ACREUA_03515 [Burkholderiales bacterium]
MHTLLFLAFAWIVLGAVSLGVMYHRLFLSLWREPTLKYPVLIIESDDWGPGPDGDAEQLKNLVDTLSVYHDIHGRSPVMTLGIILAIPDTARFRENPSTEYRRITLSDPRFAAIRQALQDGVARGVFALQLHAMEHYWPPAVTTTATHNCTVAEWLTQEGLPRTEDLPPQLQSGWIDASVLPSKPIPDELIRVAAIEEVGMFYTIFRSTPQVAVPTTFIWNKAVEIGWGSAGIRFVVTPGKRCEARDEEARPIVAEKLIVNGQVSDSGVMYMVRDEYFEPTLGHRAERGLAALERKTLTGRPTLLETHRFNFTGAEQIAKASMDEVSRLLAIAVQRFPDILFMPTEKLATCILENDPSLIEQNLARRVHCWLRRLYEIQGVRRLAWLFGIIIPAWLLFLTTGKGPLWIGNAAR